MKYLKLFETYQDEQTIDLVGFPSGSIIEVTEKEKELLINADFDISWDDEPDYEEGIYGQFRYMDEDYDEIEDWLLQYRDPLGYETRKFNI